MQKSIYLLCLLTITTPCFTFLREATLKMPSNYLNYALKGTQLAKNSMDELKKLRFNFRSILDSNNRRNLTKDITGDMSLSIKNLKCTVDDFGEMKKKGDPKSLEDAYKDIQEHSDSVDLVKKDSAYDILQRLDEGKAMLSNSNGRIDKVAMAVQKNAQNAQEFIGYVNANDPNGFDSEDNKLAFNMSLNSLDSTMEEAINTCGEVITILETVVKQMGDLVIDINQLQGDMKDYIKKTDEQLKSEIKRLEIAAKTVGAICIFGGPLFSLPACIQAFGPVANQLFDKPLAKIRETLKKTDEIFASLQVSFDVIKAEANRVKDEANKKIKTVKTFRGTIKPIKDDISINLSTLGISPDYIILYKMDLDQLTTACDKVLNPSSERSQKKQKNSRVLRNF